MEVEFRLWPWEYKEFRQKVGHTVEYKMHHRQFIHNSFTRLFLQLIWFGSWRVTLVIWFFSFLLGLLVVFFLFSLQIESLLFQGAFTFMVLIIANLGHYFYLNYLIPQKHIFIKRGTFSIVNGLQEFITWDHFYKLHETENLFYLAMKPKQALIIPKRAFKDETQREEFRKMCKKNIPAPGAVIEG